MSYMNEDLVQWPVILDCYPSNENLVQCMSVVQMLR